MMRGSRRPCNILLESDCSVHESSVDDCSGEDLRLPPQHGRCNDKAYAIQDMASDMRTRTNSRTCATPDEFSTGRVFTDIHSKNARHTEYGDHFSQRCTPSESHARMVRATEYGENFTRGSADDIHSKSARPLGYSEQFRQGIAENISFGNSTESEDYRRRGTEHKSSERKCFKEKLRGTSFSCNDCREPQCLSCWRKLRHSAADFSFLDGFETKEAAWRSGRKTVEQLTDSQIDLGDKASRRSILLEDPSHSGSPKWRPSSARQFYSQEGPKWKPPNNSHECYADQHYGPAEQHTLRHDPSSEEKEWHSGLRKGRGIGPGPGEWLPPFRRGSENQQTHFQRSKGVGLVPNSDEWVPPFRGDDPPYSWHRCKGSGGCPPRDQWLAPWCDSSERKNRSDLR